ncbi:hypothetical protein P7C73_g5009, partial [Tremellales sp. Uapishka_1]
MPAAQSSRQTKSNPTSPRPSSQTARTPYMVALSGWPEPIYVGRKSRPPTPAGSFSEFGEIRDGFSPTSTPTPYTNHDQPIPAPARQPAGPSTGHDRSNPHSPAGSSPASSRSSPSYSQNHFTSTLMPPPPLPPHKQPRKGAFNDPRYGASVVNANRPLPVVPTWSSSPPSRPSPPVSSSRTYQSEQLACPSRASPLPHYLSPKKPTPFLAQRAVPDVYPPPNVTPPKYVGRQAQFAPLPMAELGLATEPIASDGVQKEDARSKVKSTAKAK